MRFLDKLALKIFSLIVVFLLVIIAFVIIGIIPASDVVRNVMLITDSEDGIKIAAAVGGILLLLAFKGLFFTSKSPDDGKNGIVLENNAGKLVLSKESLENIIANVVRDVPGADIVSSKTVVDKDKNLVVYLTTTMSKDVMIKEVSKELQDKIKDAMKRTADLDVGEINIKVKNISSKRVKGLPEPVDYSEEKYDSLDEDNKTIENNESSETSENNE